MKLTAAIRRAWSGLRRMVGDDAYERYCAHQRGHHPGEPVLGRREYYLLAQQRKWGGVNRCC